MKTRIFVLLALFVSLVVFPGLASGEARELESASSSSAMFNPLTYVEAHFDYGLAGATSVVVSPDENHVYVVSAGDDAISVFSRDTSTGVLSFVEQQQVNGGLDMSNPQSVAVSPDNNHVYVASQADNAVTVFDRDTLTGALTFVERIQDGGGVDGLQGAYSVAVSPLGEHVYVAGKYEDAVAIFSRSVITGGLTYRGVIKDGGGVDGLAGVHSVVVSPDGDQVYVASSTDNAVAIFNRDDSNGDLIYKEAIKDGGSVDGLNGARSIAISLDGAHVYVVGSGDNAVAIFSRDVAGALTYQGMVQNGVDGVEGLLAPYSVAISADGNQVYVACVLNDTVVTFDRNASTGVLTYAGFVQDDVDGIDGLDGAASVAVASDGGHVYAVSLWENALVSFNRDGTIGTLTFLRMWQTTSGLKGAIGAAVSPDGDHVYVASNDEDAVVSFERIEGTGALVLQGVERDGIYAHGLDGARAVAIDPDGENVYVAGFSDDAVTVFNRTASGYLYYVQTVEDGVDGVDGLNGPQALTVSPDGDHVYVAGYYDDSVAIFSRSVITGGLSYEGVIKDGDSVPGDTVDGLNGAYAVVVSPDGDHVYVAGIADDAVAIFSRDEFTGLLTYEDVVKDTDTLVNGLNGANSLAFSPDGEYLYVASRDEDAVAVFQRVPSTGDLSEIEVQRDGVGGVDGLNGARAVAVSPDGSQVYVASQVANTLAVFARHEEGDLFFVGMHQNNVNGVDGLDTAGGVAVSPDSGHVYVTGYGDDAVAVFARWRVYLPLVLKD